MEECWAAVTGASRGIGFIAARALAIRGCNLIVGARTPEPLEEAARALSSEYGVEAIPVLLDLRSSGSVETFMRSALEESGYRLDVLAMSSGNPLCEPCTLSEASWWDWLEAVQLYIASVHLAMKIMAEENAKRPGRVIVFSSWTIREPQPPLSVADVVRAGLPALVRLAAREWPERIIPILVLLGSFDTPGARRTIEGIARRLGRDPGDLWREEVEARSPLRRTGRVEELMELVSFLARAPEYMAGSVVEFHGSSTRCAC